MDGNARLKPWPENRAEARSILQGLYFLGLKPQATQAPSLLKQAAPYRGREEIEVSLVTSSDMSIIRLPSSRLHGASAVGGAPRPCGGV